MSHHESCGRCHSPICTCSAPAPVPEDVAGAISELEAEVSAGAGCDDQRCPVDHIAEAKRLRAALLAAISRAIAEAREGALREAREVLRLCEWADDDWCPVCGAGQFGDKVHRPNCRLDALLASPPPAHEEGGR